MILREGHLPLLVAGVAAALVSNVVGWLSALPLWLLLAWLTWIYWEHRPPVPADPRGVLSPVAGRVTLVGEADDPILERRAQRVRIEEAFPGEMPLRSPTEGKVMDLYARRGVFGAEQRAVVLADPDGYRVRVAGYSSASIPR